MSKIGSESDWQNLIQSFVSNSQNIVEKIIAISDGQWSEPFVKEEYGSYERNIEGLIEHSYYHFGQISLLLKLLGEESDIA